MADNNNEDIKRSSGTVTWFNGWKGFGFIAPDEPNSEELFVHQTAINFEGYRTLHDGQRVEFDVEVGDDGRTRAINVDGLRNNIGNNRRNSNSNNNSNNNNNVECYNCGRFGHLARDCYYNSQGVRGNSRGRGRGRGGLFINKGDDVEGNGRGRGGQFIDRVDNVSDGDGGGRRPRGRGGRRGGGIYRGGRGGGRGGGGGRGCFNCGEEGHFARDCPNNDNPQN